jgi:hypothetical protein
MRSEILREKVMENYKSNRGNRLLKLSLKLEQNLSYLDIQEMKELLPQLTLQEQQKHQKQLKMLSNKIAYRLKTVKIN